MISWDGVSPPLACIDPDAEPAFDIILFDYSGGDATPVSPVPVNRVMRQRTECKGELYTAFADDLVKTRSNADYVALIDDDIEVSVSALNDALALARAERLDGFALALTPDSHVNHRRFVQRKGSVLRATPWVEVMMPFYRHTLFLAAAPFYRGSISSYGIDQFAMPMMSRLTGCDRIAVIDRYAARHARPVTSDGRVYRNGLTAHQERVALRRRCLAHLGANAPDLVGTRWYYRTFAPLDGPGRFWPLRLAWPWHQLRRLFTGSPGQRGYASARAKPS